MTIRVHDAGGNDLEVTDGVITAEGLGFDEVLAAQNHLSSLSLPKHCPPLPPPPLHSLQPPLASASPQALEMLPQRWHRCRDTAQ